MSKIVIFGGSGCLGINILKNLACKSPTRSEIDITNYESLSSSLIFEGVTTIIHSAGYIDTEGCETHPQKCLDVNVIGTYNLVKFCRARSIKLVYISSEYVFDGLSKEYFPNSPVCPKNMYGLSKASSELMVRTLENYLIIRAPFIRTKSFMYENAFDDQFTVRQYVDKAAKDIVECVSNNLTGIKHVVGNYQSVYDLAKQTKANVGRIETPKVLREILPMNLNLIDGNRSPERYPPGSLLDELPPADYQMGN